MAGEVPRGRLRRGSLLGRMAAGHAARRAQARLSMAGRTEEARRVLAERSTLQAAQQLVAVLGSMKGAAMKLGQMLSVLDIDLVPESHRQLFREKLAELRDQAPAVEFSEMRGVIEAEIGPLGTAFSEFDETPIAAASIGQVYRAELRDGRAVAVKVQYPGIDAAIDADVRNLEFFAGLWKSMVPSAADSAVLAEIAVNLKGELDYRCEAISQRRVAAWYRDHPFVTVPDIIETYCGQRVLVTEFVEGGSFDRIRELSQCDRDRFGELICRFYISSLFTDYEFCGDPHPGNILLAADGRLAFVDFGLYNRMDPEDADFERICLRAAGEYRADDLYNFWMGRGIVDPDAKISPQDCLEYVWAAAGWHLSDEEITVTPELATGALVLAIDPRADRFHGMHRQLLPPEHVFSRRADLFTFATLGQLGARNNWHRIAREWLYREPPVTDIGQAEVRWREQVARRA
ncbi:ABC1 kinase family protein [Nocardia rhamnosiphila]